MSRRQNLDEVRELLAESGLPWRMENGKRHHKFFLGEKLAVVMPHGGGRGVGRTQLNVMATLRRKIQAAGGPSKPIDGTGSTPLPALATALVVAEKQRRSDVTNIQGLKFASTPSNISIRVPSKSYLTSSRWRPFDFQERPDGTLAISYRKDASAYMFSVSQGRPMDARCSAPREGLSKKLSQLPQFGSTHCQATEDDGLLVIIVPATGRVPVQFRRPNAPKTKTAAVAAERRSEPTLAELVRAVNEHVSKDDGLTLSVTAEGKLRATIMVEYE